MKNAKLISIITLIVGAAIFAVSLVFYIMSFGSEDYGEYGAEFWSNSDYLLFMFDGVAFAAFGGYLLYEDAKAEVSEKMLNEGGSLTDIFTGFITAAYSFGMFFRAIAKGNGFSAWYFIFAIIGLLVLGGGVVIHFHLVKKNNNK